MKYISIPKFAKGFTLIELLLVMGIFAILAALSGINFFSTFAATNLSAARDILITDLKTAQSSAMSGKGQNGAILEGWGVIVNNNTSYTIFPGTVYDSNNPENLTTTLASGITIVTTFPSSNVSFARGSGEILGFVDGQNTFTLSGGGASKSLSINRYGVLIGE